ncbi:MAG: hypothetical protein COV48_15745 [Elusimicrobia bacterium CG11_big_fil_rev_8_21_14_0_20_64_6]|nr:MAG: hypothetical protein COV48_15745 [Elusimicrobia bacterium CG11_big_fil_rev_8_21_14_0_20_64_6]
MGGSLLALIIMTAQPSYGTCFGGSSCQLGCCEQSGIGAPCRCSACCLTPRRADDDLALVYWDGGRVAAVYRHHVDFYGSGELRPALLESDGAAHPLRGSPPARGRLRFVDAAGRVQTAAPETSRAFTEAIRTGGHASRRGDFLVCTDTAWGVSRSTSSEREFCGAMNIDGRELFRLVDAEARGIAREPVGISGDGAAALFVLSKARAKSKEREVVGYRLWSRKRGSQTLPPESPRAKKLLREYEGPLVLPSLATGSGGN